MALYLFLLFAKTLFFPNFVLAQQIFLCVVVSFAFINLLRTDCSTYKAIISKLLQFSSMQTFLLPPSSVFPAIGNQWNPLPLFCSVFNDVCRMKVACGEAKISHPVKRKTCNISMSRWTTHVCLFVWMFDGFRVLMCRGTNYIAKFIDQGKTRKVKEQRAC